MGEKKPASSMGGLACRDGGSQALDGQELRRACVERGIDVLGKSEAEIRRALALWYKM